MRDVCLPCFRYMCSGMLAVMLLGVSYWVRELLLVCESHVTRYMSHVTRYMSHVTRHTSHVTRHTSHVTRHTSHFTRHTSHVTCHTSHVTCHTSHVTRSVWQAMHALEGSIRPRVGLMRAVARVNVFAKLFEKGALLMRARFERATTRTVYSGKPPRRRGKNGDSDAGAITLHTPTT